MVTKNNAWWMTRTNGIYQYNISPLQQRAFAGFPREMMNMVRLHWRGFLYVSGLCTLFYGVKVWAEDYNLRHFHRKKGHQHGALVESRTGDKNEEPGAVN
jgi:hypothetical protein